LSLTIIDAIVKAIRDSIENSKKVDIKHFKVNIYLKRLKVG